MANEAGNKAGYRNRRRLRVTGQVYLTHFAVIQTPFIVLKRSYESFQGLSAQIIFEPGIVGVNQLLGGAVEDDVPLIQDQKTGT